MTIIQIMINNDFAQTGKKVSALGLGTVKFGRNQGIKYPSGNGFTLPTDNEIEIILDICLENGLNLIDTAPSYGTSESRLGKLMGARRDDFFVVSKCGEEFENNQSTYTFTREHTTKSIQRSLKRLNTDHLDCVLVHCNPDDVNILKSTAVLEVLEEFKQKGDILSYGASIYTAEAAKYTIDYTDAIMLSYNLSTPEMLPFINTAAEKKRAVLIKKGLNSGHATDPSEAIAHITGLQGVTSMIFGSITPQNILNNINAVTLPKTDQIHNTSKQA